MTQGWMFIFRALNYLTTALTLSLSDYLSESQSDVARCPHIPQGSSRGQRVKNKIRGERIGRGRVEKEKEKKEEIRDPLSKNTCRDSGNFPGTIATRRYCKIIIE